MNHRSDSRLGLIALLVVAALSIIALFSLCSAAWACPFCQTISATFTEEIEAADIAVFAKMVEGPKRDPADVPPGGLDVTPPYCKFEVVELIKGKDTAAKGKRFDAVYFGDLPIGTEFLVTGIDPPKTVWNVPIGLTARTKRYMLDALQLPKEGNARLAFFQDFLEDRDEPLTRDAYDEFAKTPFSGIRAFKAGMNHDQLVSWIKNPEIISSRRRLYFTMLSVCGTERDVPMLEAMLKSPDRKQKEGLDALISCYLSLQGAEGMPLIEDLYLKDEKSEYIDTYAAIQALRFQGQEGKTLSRERILAGFHHMLDRPKLADLVIPDLARWKDWAVMDRVFELYQKSTDATDWIRIPVINYLRACPEPKAKTYLAELSRLDPEMVKRAIAFFPMGEASDSPKTNDAPVPKDAATSGREPKKKGATDVKQGDPKTNSPKNDVKSTEKPIPPVVKPVDRNQTRANPDPAENVVTVEGESLRTDPPSALSPSSPWFYALTFGMAITLTAVRRVVRKWIFVR